MMKKLIALCVAALCVSNVATAEQWPPANETPERASHF